MLKYDTKVYLNLHDTLCSIGDSTPFVNLTPYLIFFSGMNQRIASLDGSLASIRKSPSFANRIQQCK